MENIRIRMEAIVVRWTALIESGKDKGDPDVDACMTEYNQLDYQRREEIAAGKAEKCRTAELLELAGLEKLVADEKLKLTATPPEELSEQGREWKRKYEWEEKGRRKRVADSKPGKPQGSFKWSEVRGKKFNYIYLQYSLNGKTLATFPADAGVGLWCEMNRLLKGTAKKLPKSTTKADDHIWAYNIREHVVLPTTHKTIKPLLEFFQKAFRLVLHWKRNTITPTRRATIEKQQKAIETVLQVWNVTVGEVQHKAIQNKTARDIWKFESAAQAEALLDRNPITPRTRQAMKVETGADIEKGVRKCLQHAKSQGWIRGYTEEDVEDICGDEQLNDLLLLEKLEKQDFPDDRPSVYGARTAAARWIAAERLRDEDSLSDIVGTNEDGTEMERIEILRPTPAVTNKHGIVLNDVCTQDQAELEHDCVEYLPPERKAELVAAVQSLGPDRAWLQTYEATKGSRGHSPAERMKAMRLRRKAIKLVGDGAPVTVLHYVKH